LLRKLSFISLVAFIIISFSGRSGLANDSCEMLIDFYHEYLSYHDTVLNLKQRTFKSKFAKYMTPEGLKKTWDVMTHEGYDPIVQGQDYSPHWKSHLKAILLKHKRDQIICKVVLDPSWPQEVIVKLQKKANQVLISEFSNKI